MVGQRMWNRVSKHERYIWHCPHILEQHVHEWLLPTRQDADLGLLSHNLASVVCPTQSYAYCRKAMACKEQPEQAGLAALPTSRAHLPWGQQTLNSFQPELDSFSSNMS